MLLAKPTRPRATSHVSLPMLFTSPLVKFFCIQYIGETKDALKKLFYGHRSTVNTKKVDTPVGNHFNLPNHALSDMILQGIESLGIRNDVVRVSGEKHWMKRLCTIQPQGLNIQEDMANKQKSRVQVGVRLRPELLNEDKDKKPCVHGLGPNTLEIWNWRDSQQTIKYEFDAFFDKESTQKQVYEGCVRPLLLHTVMGQNASVFAYGPTGAGKTHTMLGTNVNPGIIPRTVNGIFHSIRSNRWNKPDGDQWAFKVTFSYLEIYQEKVYDLLDPKKQDLPIRQDMDNNILIPNLADKQINSVKEFQSFFVPASKNRTTAATKLNSRSSRSHSILLLKIQKTQKQAPYIKQLGKMYLIDLAGSENNKRTGNQGIRLKESGAINTSLFVLGQVVDALNQGLPRIPYRDSKLTRLLQDSLGGSSHAYMITNIAPEERNYMDTYTTLNLAAKSRKIINRPFTRETIENPTKGPLKRSLSGNTATNGTPSAKITKTSQSKAQDAVPFLSPLLKRQANFEETMRQRLQSLETILTQLQPTTAKHSTKNSQVAQTNKEALHQLTQSRKNLMNLQQGHRDLKEKCVVFKPKPNFQSVCARKNENKSSEVPKAVVRPMTAPTNFSPSVPGCQKQGVPGKVSVQFVKVIKPNNKDTPETEPKTETVPWTLKPNPVLQAKHTAEIMHVLNAGTVKDLKSLQSIGEKRAQLIHNWRQMCGQFENISDLYKVNGLPVKTVDSIIRNNLLTSSVME